MKSMVSALCRFAFVSSIILLAPGCATNVLAPRQLSSPATQLDNSLPFQPDRIWRVVAHWEPYMLDQSRAKVVKRFQYVARAEQERKRLEKDIIDRGGERQYLKWLETELFPLGEWDIREEANIMRFADYIVVTFVVKSARDMKKSGRFNAAPVVFPDHLLRALEPACPELNWDVIAKGESVGFEVVLESRKADPSAEHWQRQDYDGSYLSWRSWSVSHKNSVSYRTVVFLKNNFPRCPLPNEVFEQIKRIARPQSMGVDW